MIIVAYGLPAPQGSKKFVGMRGGHAVLVESSKKVLGWRKTVKDAAVEARYALNRRERIDDCNVFPPCLDGPLAVTMVFTMPRPRSHYRAGRFSHLLRNDAPEYPTVYPDLSKLIRCTEDALTDAGVWADDARAVRYDLAMKLYVFHPGALASPGVTIEIKRIA